MDAIAQRLFQAIEVFTAYFNDSTTVFIIAVGLAIGLLVLGISVIVSGVTSSSRRRIRAVVQDRSLKTSAGNQTAQRVESAIAPAKSVILPGSEKERSQTEKRLQIAGYYDRSAMSVYYFLKLVLSLVFGLVALVATTFFPQLPTLNIVMITAAAAFVGSIIPSYILDKRVAARQKRIINAFPDMLDMLVACSEAGLGLNAAIQRVSREIQPSFPDLGDELEIVNAEMLAGVERVQALKGLAKRTDISEIQGFVSMLSQSVRFGTGIAETLRIYAEEFRDKRTQKAEEVAAKIGAKLIFPLVFCFFPSFFLVAIGPAVIQLVKAFQVGQ